MISEPDSLVCIVLKMAGEIVCVQRHFLRLVPGRLHHFEIMKILKELQTLRDVVS